MKRSAAFIIALLIGLEISGIAGPSVFPTGTTLYNPEKAYNSFVVITGGDGFGHLIDMNGNSVHEWKNASVSLTTSIDPALTGGKRGHALVTLSMVEGQGTDLVPGAVTTRIAKTIAELDWDGKTVWTFGDKMPGGLARQHHDWARLPNGNTLVLSNLVHAVKNFKMPYLLDDVVYEVNPKGDVVWSWVASDHLAEFGLTAEQMQLVRNTDDGDYLHLNSMKPVGSNRWFAAGDSRFAPDNIIIDSRNANFIAIIDRMTGNVVWRLGPNYPMANTPPTSRKVPRPLDRTSGQHDAQIIPEGLPGAGNLLVFDNEGEAGYPAMTVTVTGGSRVLEIDPIKQQIVWQYTGEDSGGPGWSFRSTHISSARRLPNGNTLICEGQAGRVFQVTRDGEIVWEYVNAYPRNARDPNTGRSVANYALYRAQPVPYDWVPAGTSHSEKPVTPPDNTQFRIR
jgi:Arylsulfotransferase (ASST)